jgi:hypothetical protein
MERSPSHQPAGNLRNALVSSPIVSPSPSYRILSHVILTAWFGPRSACSRHRQGQCLSKLPFGSLPLPPSQQAAKQEARSKKQEARSKKQEASKQQQCVRQYTADGSPSAPFLSQRAAPGASTKQQQQQPKSSTQQDQIKQRARRNKHTESDGRRGSPIGAPEACCWVPEALRATTSPAGGS